jgi:WD40 repeat protein
MVTQVAQKGPGYQNLAPITHLPLDITLLFLLLLPGPQVARTKRICKYFAQVVNNENLWARLCQRDLPATAIPSNLSPSLHYKRCFLTEQNWRKGRYVYQRLTNCENPLSLSGHQLFSTGPELSILCENRWPIHIWDLNNTSCCTVEGFPIHDDIDTCLHDEDILVSGANSGPCGGRVFKVWNKATGVFLWAGKTHCKVMLDGPRLIVPDSNYNDATRLSTGHILACDKRTGHRQWSILDPALGDFYSVRLKGNHLFATTLNKEFVKYWNKNTGEFVRQVGSAEKPLSTYEPDSENLVCGFISGKISVLNKENGTVIHELVDLEGEGEIACLLIDEEVILASNRACHFACWSKASGSLLFKIKAEPAINTDWNRYSTNLFLSGPQLIWNRGDGKLEIRNKYTGLLVKSCIAGERSFTILNIDDYRIITHSYSDNRVKIWDKRTGDLLFVLNGIRCKVFGNRMVIENNDKTVDVCDFSASPEIPFANKGQLQSPPKP